MVPADSQQIPRARCYSGNPTTHTSSSSATGLSPTPAGHSKPLHLTTMRRRGNGSHRTSGPTTPHTQPLPGITCTRFSLIHVRSPLLAESLLFSSPTGTEMFHFPALPPHHLCIQQWATTHNRGQVSPFGHPRINALLATPRGLSWPYPSFIGSLCQGIHRAPLKVTNQTLRHTQNTHHKAVRIR